MAALIYSFVVLMVLRLDEKWFLKFFAKRFREIAWFWTARNKPKAPGKRLPVRAGWRYGFCCAAKGCSMCFAGIKRC